MIAQTGYEQFLLFPLFSKDLYCRQRKKPGLVLERDKHLQNTKLDRLFASVNWIQNKGSMFCTPPGAFIRRNTVTYFSPRNCYLEEIFFWKNLLSYIRYRDFFLLSLVYYLFDFKELFFDIYL